MVHVLSPVAEIEQWLGEGDHQKAHHACLGLLADHPNNPELLTLLSLCDDAMGLSDQAQARLESIVVGHPKLARAWFHLARVRANRGDACGARQAISVSIELAPNHAPSRHLLAYLDHQDQAIQAAISGYKTALMADQEYLPAWCDLALALIDAGQLNDAHEAATKALDINANDPAVQFVMGRICSLQDKLDEALKHFTQATDLDPDFYQGLLALVEVQQQRGEHAQALVTLDRLSGEQKSHTVPRYLRALSLLSMEQPKPAFALLEHIPTHAPDLSLALALIDRLEHTGDQKVLQAFGQKLDKDQPHLDACAQWIEALVANLNGDRDLSKEKLKVLIDSPVKPISLRARLALTRLYLQDNVRHQALEILEGVGDPRSLHYRVAWEMAALAADAGDVKLAEQFLEVVLARPVPPAVIAKTQALKAKLCGSTGPGATLQ